MRLLSSFFTKNKGLDITDTNTIHAVGEVETLVSSEHEIPAAKVKIQKIINQLQETNEPMEPSLTLASREKNVTILPLRLLAYLVLLPYVMAETERKVIPTPTNFTDEPGVTPLDRTRLAFFDNDIRDDCRSLLDHCQSDIFAHVYLQCPASCSKFLEEEGMVGTAHDNPDALYDVGTLRTYRGKRVDSDRFEGYVLVLAVVPLLPGMAVYYYEMMEHLHTVFVPRVEFVILPIDHELGIHIQLREEGVGKVVVLEEESAVTATDKHPWIRHLTSVKPRSGLGTTEHGHDTILQRPLQTDRVTFYIVSADGYYIERLISPSMEVLQQRIRLYEKTIDYEL